MLTRLREAVDLIQDIKEVKALYDLKSKLLPNCQGPDMVEFTGFLNNKFRVKAVAGDNLVSAMVMNLMMTMVTMVMIM